MSDSIIERAARAAYEQGERENSAGFGCDWDAPELVQVRETFRCRTRAILHAIRTPDIPMTVAFHNQFPGPSGATAEDVWQAMIDAALES